VDSEQLAVYGEIAVAAEPARHLPPEAASSEARD